MCHLCNKKREVCAYVHVLWLFFFNSGVDPMPMRGIIVVVGKLRQEAVKCLSAGSQQLHLDWYLFFLCDRTALSLTSGLNMSAKDISLL